MDYILVSVSAKNVFVQKHYFRLRSIQQKVVSKIFIF